MDPLAARIFAALLSVGALTFLGAPFLASRPYRFMPGRRALLTRALSCAIAGGYFLASYVVLYHGGSYGTIAVVLGCTGLLNVLLVVLEWPYLKRREPGTNERG